MNPFIISALLVISLLNPMNTFAKGSIHNSARDIEIKEIHKLFDVYMQKYNHYLTTKEFNEAPYIYHDRIMIMTTSAEPYTIETSKFYQGTQSFLDNLEKEGVKRISWIDINVRLLDKNLALASNSAARYSDKGQELNRAGATYLIRKSKGEWRIAAFTIHEADGMIEL